MSLHLHIERLVLDGIDTGGQPHLLQAAIEAELARLLGEAGREHALAQAGSYASARLSLALPAVGTGAGSGPGAPAHEPGTGLGQRIAAAVVGGIAP